MYWHLKAVYEHAIVSSALVDVDHADSVVLPAV